MKLKKAMYYIVTVLNNSAVIASDGNKEIVLIGQGIGFGKKKGDIVDVTKHVEKAFELQQSVGQFTHIVNGYDAKVVDAVMVTINVLSSLINRDMEDTALLAFIDHMAGCFSRIDKGADMQDFFYHETKILYPESFEIAQQIEEKVKEHTSYVLPKTEVAYMALHIQNIDGEIPRQLMDQLNLIVTMIDEMLSQSYGITMDKRSYNYSRFLMHLKALIRHVFDRNVGQRVDLSEMVVEKYPHQYEMATKIKEIIETELSTTLSNEESAYIAIHLLNLK